MKNERPTAALAAPKHWMDAYGIKYEERLTVTKAQLELKMRPCFSLKTRIWADGILHSAGYQGEHAQMMKGGHKIAVQTADIADDLMKAAAKYYRDAGILLDKAAYEALRPGTQEMRRAIADMEEDGICERRYKGKPVRDMPLKERQARLNGKIDLYFWLRPRKAQADIVRQEYEQARETETTPPDFSATRVINHLQAESKRLSLFILHLEPSKQETITKAWDEFVQVFKKCIPEVDNQTPPEVVTERPPSINEEIVEEKSVKQQPHPHPPRQPEEGRMMMEFPLTLQCLRERDPAVKEAFARRLYSDTVAYCRKHPQFDIADLAKITDHALAAMCKESFRTGPKNHGTGLLLSRVPAIAVTWSLDDEENRPTQRTA